MQKMAEKIDALEREAAAKQMKEKDESMSEMKAKMATFEARIMSTARMRAACPPHPHHFQRWARSHHLRVVREARPLLECCSTWTREA